MKTYSRLNHSNNLIEYTKIGVAVVLMGLLFFEFVRWSTFTPIAHAGGGFALESTQQQNRELLQNILDDNQDVRNERLQEVSDQTEQIMEDTMDLRQFWIEDSPAQWEANIRVIEAMVEEVVEFTQSGFGGNPAFVTDLTRYIEQAQDDAGTRFIERMDTVIDLPYADFRTTLMQLHQRRMGGQLEGFRDIPGVGRNVDAFFYDSAGGWDAFRHMTQGQSQTALDAFLAVSMQLDNVIRQTAENELTALNWSQGFLSAGQCQTVQGRQVCEVSTPGAIIANQVNTALESGFDAAIAAQIEGQDLDSAIFDGLRMLSNDVLNQANGLMGLNDFLAGFNLDNLLRDLNPENIIFDLLETLFGPEDQIVDNTGQVQPEILDQVRENIDRILNIQDDALAQLGRLAPLFEDRTPEETDAIIVAVLGEDYNNYLARVDTSYNDLILLSNRLNNLAQEAASTNTTQVAVLRDIINELSIVQDRLPSSDDVAAWERTIDSLGG